MATAVAAVLSLVFLVALVAGRLGADPAPGSQLLAGEVRGAAVVAACVPARPASATVLDATITVGDLDRAYRLHLPRGYTGSEQVPLVLLLHGTGGTIDGFEEYTRFTDAAVARGYAVATPQGVGDPQGGVPAHWTVPGFPGPDDVAFVESLVREVAASSCIDLRRVYATGLSSGGAFSAYLGCQSTMFAALAPVAGANLVRPCAGPPVSVLAIHGTADPYVDYDGLDPRWRPSTTPSTTPRPRQRRGLGAARRRTGREEVSGPPTSRAACSRRRRHLVQLSSSPTAATSGPVPARRRRAVRHDDDIDPEGRHPRLLLTPTPRRPVPGGQPQPPADVVRPSTSSLARSTSGSSRSAGEGAAHRRLRPASLDVGVSPARSVGQPVASASAARSALAR
jgi:polyhydroxybutyrate depolymerase